MASSQNRSTLMVCPRNFTLRTTLGHTIQFKAGEPTPVPNEVVELALAVNILPAPNQALPAHNEGHASGFTKIAAMPQLLREAIVMRCLDELVRENNPANFSGGGRPKPASIRERCAIDVSATETNKAWERYRELKANNEDLPSHRNLDLIYDIQQTSSPKTLREFAQELDMPPAEYTGLSVTELKAAVVAYAVKFDAIAQTALKAVATKLDESVDS
jgi:hypothetical protein